MDRGAWWAAVHGVAKELDMTQRLNNSHHFSQVKTYYLKENSFMFCYLVLTALLSGRPKGEELVLLKGNMLPRHV